MRIASSVLWFLVGLVLSAIALPTTSTGGAGDLLDWRLGALVLTAWTSGVFAAECWALTVSWGRALRVGGPAARAELGRSARWWVGGFVLLLGLATLVRTEVSAVLPGSTSADAAVVLLGLGLIAVAFGKGADWVSGAGVGNGWAVLLLVDPVLGVIDRGFGAIAGGGLAYLPPIDELAAGTVGVLGTLWALNRPSADGLPALPAGVVMPVGYAWTVAGPAALLWPDGASAATTAVLLAGGLVPLFAVVLHLPANVGAVTGMPRAQVWGGLLRRMPGNIALCALLAWAPWTIWAVLGAVLWVDLRAEWRARRECDGLVVAWPLHRVYAVAVAVAALRDAGVEHTLRGLAYRSVTHFDGCLIPIEVLVRPDDLERAQAALAASTVSALPSERGAVPAPERP